MTRGVAQRKGKLNGKAQPFLTTGGEAVSKRKILQRKQEVARLLHKVLKLDHPNLGESHETSHSAHHNFSDHRITCLR